jgi:uncharacterized repeat protein (TIGR03803 family)
MANSGGNTGNGTIFKIDAFGQRTTLVHFTGTSGENRGGNPVAGLVLAGDGNFYGTTLWGGTDNLGTIFRMTPEGVYTVLVDFTGSNGAKPWSRLTVGPDGSLYAVTGEGGSSGLGVFFRLTTAGVYTKLADFTGVGGAYPGSYSSSPLTLGPDGNFYATQFSGGNNDYGTIYQMTPSGVMTILKHLDASSGGWPCGAPAFGPDGSIYGMTNDGGTSDFGTIYKITNPTTPASSVFSKLIDFSGTSGANRGAWPLGTMFYAPDGYFYGATNSGGTADMGTLFKMTTGGIMTVLTDFKGAGSGVDSGGWPYNDEFTLASDGRLYGITNVGGRQGGGLVYRIEISVPEIAVSGNGENIANNDATPSATDHTQLGQAPVASGSITRSFTITNAGSADLTLGTVSITGANAGDFTVSTAPATTVSAGNSTTLSISFDPSATGSRVAQVTFSNNDPDENPFTFSISGTGNTPPVFAGMTLDTVQGKVTVIDEAKILVRASDVDGTTVSITGFSTTSAQGATIARSGGFITWTPSPVFTGTDTFTVTLSDGTSTVQGTITLNVAADPGLNPANPPQLNFQPGGALRIAFFGIPGRTYGIQRSTDLANWTQIAAPSAGAQGSITFDDPSPPSGGAFYRIIFPAE